jgi:uncharacterized protein (DUF305 family)
VRARLIGGVLAAATAAVLAAGCSDSSNAPAAGAPTAPPTSAAPAGAVSPEHNAADVVFAQGMLPHHIQAIAMSSQASSRAASQEVKDLASRIDQEQGPEIEQMNQMLDAWGAPRPQPGSTAMPGMPGMPMGGMPMPGMMGEAGMQQLAAQSGPAFDRMFLQMMIEHHTGAVQMAQTEQAQGLNPQAKELAGAIISDQQREITEMQALLSRV